MVRRDRTIQMTRADERWHSTTWGMRSRRYSCRGRTHLLATAGACFTRFMETFEAARDAKYNPNGHPRIETSGIIPWKMDSALGREVPCTIESGVFKGYFVSQTSIAVDPTKDACDQGRYLDSFLFNATVLPRDVTWSSQGTRTDDGDLVVVRDRDNGRIAFAINGDRGPANGIGEGTIALTAALSGMTLKGDEPFSEIKKLARPNVQYVIFPKDDIRRKVGPAFTQADIDRVGKEIFERWGGVARLDDCAALDLTGPPQFLRLPGRNNDCRSGVGALLTHNTDCHRYPRGWRFIAPARQEPGTMRLLGCDPSQEGMQIVADRKFPDSIGLSGKPMALR